jgi:hypothetical protein
MAGNSLLGHECNCASWRKNDMAYPTMEQVDAASHHQLCSWQRFLPSPGADAMGGTYEKFQEVMNREALVMTRIVERVKELGGFTPEISKSLGW